MCRQNFDIFCQLRYSTLLANPSRRKFVEPDRYPRMSKTNVIYYSSVPFFQQQQKLKLCSLIIFFLSAVIFKTFWHIHPQYEKKWKSENFLSGKRKCLYNPRAFIHYINSHPLKAKVCNDFSTVTTSSLILVLLVTVDEVIICFWCRRRIIF